MADEGLASDLRGAGRLAITATLGVTRLAEALHSAIGGLSPPVGAPAPARARGLSGLVYGAVRGTTRLVGGGLDAALALLQPLLGPDVRWPGRDPVLAALQGVLGDHLERTSNPLAVPMQVRRDGVALDLDGATLASSVPDARGHVLLMIHGLCMSDVQWRRDGHDHGAALARRLGATATYLRYNSGLHVSVNGRRVSELLERLLQAWPVPVTRLTLIGHSMGGLVARSAVECARAGGAAWPSRVGALVFLGTPHHGAPLERGGHWIETLLGVSPYSAAFVPLGRIRSAGVTDLRHGSLLDADWQGRDRFAHGHDTRVPVALPEGIACYAIAAVAGQRVDPLSTRLIGDGLVPLDSALGRHEDPRRALAFPPAHTRIVRRTHHLGLLSSPTVTRQLLRWLAPARGAGGAPPRGAVDICQ
ncbi:MAG TPA: alpha/beta hydrolase [Quisquiliibacterium sp.]|mgnify:CR=1 FL=1|nr:alpha/beta hydrolase [Quisquiliibacterium sp.]